MQSIVALIQTLALPDAYHDTVQVVHRPVAQAIAARRAALGRSMVVGLCGSQGSGKSTMAAFLGRLLEDQGLSVAVLSLDDLYLTLAERTRLSHDVHPLLRTRGVPGTHDTGLGLDLLDRLTDGAQVSLPRFDKARDDRAPASEWTHISGPVDVVLFEGWCVGAAPQDEATLAAPINALERDLDPDGRWRRHVNTRLGQDYARLFARIDLLVLLQAPSFDAVFSWRALQERKLADRVAREGLEGQAMTPEQIAVFLMHYQRLTEHILREMPARADIVLPLDAQHRVLEMDMRGQ